MFPHERSLVKLLEGRPFSLVGINSDEPEGLEKKLEDNSITWRSFKNKREGQILISDQWKVRGLPTLYLIDHKGIIRNRWIGSPGADVLDREIAKLVEVAERDK